jgi:CCR4-NOT transcriptional regulation complex NOT5 subunit
MPSTAVERISVSQHLSEEALEECLMGRLPAEDELRIEEHVLWCHECCDRLEQTFTFIEAFQDAFLDLDEPVRSAENTERTSSLSSLSENNCQSQ